MVFIADLNRKKEFFFLSCRYYSKFCVFMTLHKYKLKFYRFEGISNRWLSDDCVYLSPKFGNIHSLAPLEDGTAFFDLLMPGYGDKPCTYFKNAIQNPKLKQICLLQKIAEPEDYYCQLLPYEKINEL